MGFSLFYLFVGAYNTNLSVFVVLVYHPRQPLLSRKSCYQLWMLFSNSYLEVTVTSPSHYKCQCRSQSLALTIKIILGHIIQRLVHV